MGLHTMQSQPDRSIAHGKVKEGLMHVPKRMGTMGSLGTD